MAFSAAKFRFRYHESDLLQLLDFDPLLGVMEAGHIDGKLNMDTATLRQSDALQRPGYAVTVAMLCQC